MLHELLKERNIPPLLPRAQALELLQREEYGVLPAPPDALSFTVTENIIPRFCGGNAELHQITADCTVNGKPFSFPFSAVFPTDGKPHPFFIHINFRDAVPDRYMPTEELVDNGFAVLSFCYTDVSSDDGDFTNGLAGLLFENGKRTPSDPGKIALWAWAAQRVMDWAQTKPDALDLSAGIVCGHCHDQYEPHQLHILGRTLPFNMWNSTFQCIRIPNDIAAGFVDWFETAKLQEGLRGLVEENKGDDTLFHHYMLEEHCWEPVVNLAPHLVEHVDWLLGGSVINTWRSYIARAAYFYDDDLVEELAEKLANRIQDTKAG